MNRQRIQRAKPRKSHYGMPRDRLALHGDVGRSWCHLLAARSQRGVSLCSATARLGALDSHRNSQLASGRGDRFCQRKRVASGNSCNSQGRQEGLELEPQAGLKRALKATRIRAIQLRHRIEVQQDKEEAKNTEVTEEDVLDSVAAEVDKGWKDAAHGDRAQAERAAEDVKRQVAQATQTIEVSNSKNSPRAFGSHCSARGAACGRPRPHEAGAREEATQEAAASRQEHGPPRLCREASHQPPRRKSRFSGMQRTARRS